MNQATRILKLLKQRKMFGAGNDELNRICFRYSARIKELREEGYNIMTVRQKRGYFKYFLIEEEK